MEKTEEMTQGILHHPEAQTACSTERYEAFASKLGSPPQTTTGTLKSIFILTSAAFILVWPARRAPNDRPR